jgi:hypothetical protein
MRDDERDPRDSEHMAHARIGEIVGGTHGSVVVFAQERKRSRAYTRGWPGGPTWTSQLQAAHRETAGQWLSSGTRPSARVGRRTSGPRVRSRKEESGPNWGWSAHEAFYSFLFFPFHFSNFKFECGSCYEFPHWTNVQLHFSSVRIVYVLYIYFFIHKIFYFSSF